MFCTCVGLWGPASRVLLSEQIEGGADLTKKDIAKQISSKYGIDLAVARGAVQHVFEQIMESLVTAGRMELRNFGVFEVRRRAPRVARNPRTNQQVSVPAKTVVVFHPGKNLSELIARQGQQGGPSPASESALTAPVEHPAAPSQVAQ